MDFPRLDKSKVSVVSAFARCDDRAFWLAKSPAERIEAVEFYRQIAYGYDPLTERLQRIIEVAELASR